MLLFKKTECLSAQIRFIGKISFSIIALTIFLLSTVPSLYAGGDLGNVGTFSKWSKVEIPLLGPNSIGMSDSPNPFKTVIEVTFTSSGGNTYIVPGFYDGDGSGGLNGNIWKVRFSPNEVGNWSFSTSSGISMLNGYSGIFTVSAPPTSAQFFSKWGRLQYVGKHYLKFADGPYWIKSGADEPETFLGPGVMGDWEAKKIAVDYLASKGINAMYIMTHTLEGDGNNVWPWVGSSSLTAKSNHEHFDTAKLSQWEDLFDHIQSKGIVIHLVLEDDSGWTGFNRAMYYREIIARFGHYNGIYWNISEEYGENYSANQIKSFATMIRDLDPYDHPITVHNVGNLNTAWTPFLGDTRFDITSFQSKESPQNSNAINWRTLSKSSGHPLVISFDETGSISVADRIKSRKIAWSVYMGGGNYEIFSRPMSNFQEFEDHWNDMRHARLFLEALPFWEMVPDNDVISGGSGNRYALSKAGEIYAVYIENGSSISIDLSGQSGIFQMQWYNPITGVYIDNGIITGGGVRPLGTPPISGDVAAVIKKSGLNQKPVASIALPQNGMVFKPGVEVSFSSNGSLDPDGTITAYDWSFGDGGTSLQDNPTYTYLTENTYTVSLKIQDNKGLFSTPVSIQLTISSVNVLPVAANQTVSTVESSSTSVTLSHTDPDGPGPFTYSIETNPVNGTILGTPPNITYQPNALFTGTDSFLWKVNDGIADSNLATVTINVSTNVTSTAQDFVVSTDLDTAVSFSLSQHITDPDGPGPTTFSMNTPPSNGLISGTNNDWTYSPNLGFVGFDSFTWHVNDGLANSNIATTSIFVGSFNISITSGQVYKVVDKGLIDGALVYIDRTFTYAGIPAFLDGATYIKTANDDKASTGSNFLTFNVDQNITLYVAHDDRISPKPTWMSTFADTGQDLIIANKSHSIFSKDFSAGQIILGGNEGSGNSMYTVILVPQGSGLPTDVTPPSPPMGLSVN